jgi:O-antigen ligase
MPPEFLPATISLYPAATEASFALLLAGAVPLFAAAVLFRKRSSLYLLAGVLAALGGLWGMYGLVNYLAGNEVSLHFSSGDFHGRARGPFVNPNHYAAYLGLIAPVSISVLFLKSGTWKRQGEQGFVGNMVALAGDVSRRYWKILAGLAFLTLALSLVFSASRMGIVAALAGLSVFLLLAFAFRPRSAVRSWIVAGILMGILMVSLALWIGLGPVFERFGQLEPGLAGRLTIWRDALGMTRDFPLAGTGLGTFPHVFPLYQSADLSGGYSFPHSEPVHLLCETGIVGFALAVCAFFCWAAGFLLRLSRSEIRTDRIFLAAGCFAGAFTMLLNSATELSLRIPANLFLFATLAGAASAALSGRTKKVRRGGRGASPDGAPSNGGG